MRSVSMRLSSGVARGPSAMLAGSPGMRKTAAYIAVITTIRMRSPSAIRLAAYCSMAGSPRASTEVARDLAHPRTAVHELAPLARLEAPGEMEVGLIGREFGAACSFRVGFAARDRPAILGDEPRAQRIVGVNLEHVLGARRDHDVAVVERVAAVVGEER